MRFVPLGGGHQIGASTALLELDGVHLLIDAGLDPARPDRIPDFSALARLAGLPSLDSLDAVVLTHAHLDHIGAVPDLLSRNVGLAVYCHRHTARLARPILSSLPGIADLQGRGRGWAALQHRWEDGTYPEYSERVTVHGRSGARVSLTLLDAGHLPGSACLLIEGIRQRALITGDFNHASSLFLMGTSVNPAFLDLKPDLMVIEGTYAGREQVKGPGTRPAHELVEVTRQVLQRQGRIIAPAFALGRAQEVLAWLEQGLEAGNLEALALWTDEPVRRNTGIWRTLFPGRLIHPTLLDAVPDRVLDPPEGARASLRAERWKRAERCNFVLVSPGMIQPGSPSQKHVLAALGDDRSAIFLTGYQLEGTLGARLQQRALGQKRMAGAYHGDGFYPLKAEVFQFQMSAHADHTGLVELVRRVSPGRLALVHRHADLEALRRFQDSVHPLEVLLPHNGSSITL